MLLVKPGMTISLESCAVCLPKPLELEVHTARCFQHIAQPDSPHTVLVDLKRPRHQLLVRSSGGLLLITIKLLCGCCFVRLFCGCFAKLVDGCVFYGCFTKIVCGCVTKIVCGCFARLLLR